MKAWISILYIISVINLTGCLAKSTASGEAADSSDPQNKKQNTDASNTKDDVRLPFSLTQKDDRENPLQERFESPDSSSVVTQMAKRHIGSLLPSLYISARDKKHFSSILKCKTFVCFAKAYNDATKQIDRDDLIRSDQPDLARDKKHLGAYMRYLSSRGMLRKPTKRFFSTILQGQDTPFDENDEIVNKHQSEMNNEHDVDDDIYQMTKRHIGSLVGNRGYSFRPSMLDLTKRYYASLLNNYVPKRSSSLNPTELHDSAIEDNRWSANPSDKFDQFPNEGKRHISSLIDDPFNKYNPFVFNQLDESPNPSVNKKSDMDMDEEKRHLSSLLRNYDVNDFLGAPESDGLMSRTDSRNKKHISSLLSEDKRHISSLLNNDKRSAIEVDNDYLGSEKRHLASLLQKRHISSLLQRYGPDLEKRHLSSLFGDAINNEEKRHIASIFAERGISSHSRTKRNAPTDIELSSDIKPEGDIPEKTPNKDNEIHPSPLFNEESHSRQKRYLGALARANNFPFRQSRAIQYRTPVAPPATETFFDDIEKFIREELKKESVREHLGMGDFQREAIPYIPMRNSGNYPGKIIVMDSADENPIEDEKNDYFPLQDVGFFRGPQKRFVGHLARQSWSPRRYRSFVPQLQPPSNSGSPIMLEPSNPTIRYTNSFRPPADYFVQPAFRG